VSESTVKRWEAGDPSLTPGYRLAIATVCEVPPQFLENGWGVLEPSDIEKLLKRQDAVLERIEKAIARQNGATTETEEARQSLLKAAEAASRVYEDAARRLAEARDTPAT
jgi:hypothetical protein